MIELPKLKQEKSQGETGYNFLELINKEPFRKVTAVRAEFKPIVLEDKRKRVEESKSLTKSFLKRISTHEGTEAFFNDQYGRLGGYLNAFDLVSTQGHTPNTEITLSFFGSYLLENCIQNKVRDIFAVCNNEFLARLYLFIDNYKKWYLIQIIKGKDSVTVDNLNVFLLEQGIGFDLEKIKDGIIAKPDFRDQLLKEWKKNHSSPIMEYKWRKEMTEKLAQNKILERQRTNLESILNLYIEVGLVMKKNDALSCNTRLISELKNKSFWNTSEKIEPKSFFDSIYKNYFELRRNEKNITIPIPYIRKKVCLDLKMPWPSFDKILTKFPRGFGDIGITLTRSSGLRNWGLVINSKPFYFISAKKGGV